ncbi:hypothetical protein Sjap_001842 [Stephania japonica]|uniref:protein-serine/threonine phosphatase n=1 Tax=Stephania japonica TaxID=461633 RepID=A0AAP0KKP5_9MAGN
MAEVWCGVVVVGTEKKAAAAGSSSSSSSSSTEGETSSIDHDETKTSNCSTSLDSPKFGVTSVIGRRRDMEDAVAVHPSFCRKHNNNIHQARLLSLHYFGIYDGHGCSHVATCCKNRMHEFVKEELERGDEQYCPTGAGAGAGAGAGVTPWKDAMDRSFSRMDQEAIGTSSSTNNSSSLPTRTSSSTSTIVSSCRCELQMPECDAVGSTAVISIVTPDKIIVANCGDSRAVLCRAGKPLPLSNDHKPDRPDELERIQDAGGHVIFWDGPRVQGVLATSRAIGDNYLKPYVSSEPEVTVTERTDYDECLILASDGLWDVISNDTACQIALTCLRGQTPLHLLLHPSQITQTTTTTTSSGEDSDQACSDAALLLTKLALARNSSDNVSVVIVDLRAS